MEHTEAVSQFAVEKYLLGELSPEARSAFEEHYFGCEECATDLRAAAMFVSQAKKELARPSFAQAQVDAPKRKLFSFATFSNKKAGSSLEPPPRKPRSRN